ncbi:hypothetical protein H6G33_10080 [Calothrix sp. FACHB-1219]|uniref:hypothetical protein n=1 Tax=unclassified Calothrix TaxID=2619626 RepID=UPI001682C0F1|nr:MULTISPECIES: hypothetical protein [unclassified Calothrix]MBD2201695.1 hypothetical protein [Calothrix sp. FACHB-168]MBD2217381.1 hypothetical protein [Calothrix sp. FACHB-1219]
MDIKKIAIDPMDSYRRDYKAIANLLLDRGYLDTIIFTIKRDNEELIEALKEVKGREESYTHSAYINDSEINCTRWYFITEYLNSVGKIFVISYRQPLSEDIKVTDEINVSLVRNTEGFVGKAIVLSKMEFQEEDRYIGQLIVKMLN